MENPYMARRLDEREGEKRACVQCIRAACAEAAWRARRSRRTGETCRDRGVGSGFARDTRESTGTRRFSRSEGETEREERVRSCLDSRRRFAGGATKGGNCSKNRATFALAACESQRLSLPLHRESLGSESAAASKN